MALLQGDINNNDHCQGGGMDLKKHSFCQGDILVESARLRFVLVKFVLFVLVVWGMPLVVSSMSCLTALAITQYASNIPARAW